MARRTRARAATRRTRAERFPVAEMTTETSVRIKASCGEQMRFIREGKLIHCQKQNSYDDMQWNTEASFDVRSMLSLCEALIEMAAPK
jgi:hypothetical protein